MKLIGLYGPSRAGKDEVAKILTNNFSYEQRAQADAIRKILLGLNPLVVRNDGGIVHLQDLYFEYEGNWDLIKADSRDSVDAMIALGQTCRDVLGLDVWLSTALPELGYENPVVISDVRQPNEYEAIVNQGGEVWKISRPGVEFRAMDGLLEGKHFHALIDNNGTLKELEHKVNIIMAKRKMDNAV